MSPSKDELVIQVHLNPAPPCPADPHCVAQALDWEWFNREAAEEAIRRRREGRICSVHGEQIVELLVGICEQGVRDYEHEAEAYENDRAYFEKAAAIGATVPRQAAHMLRRANLETADPWRLLRDWVKAGIEGERQRRALEGTRK